eukprot:444298_1
MMFQILTDFKNHKVIEREQLLNQLELKYTSYISQLLHQKSIITQTIQNKYDKQINLINDLILTHVYKTIDVINQTSLTYTQSDNNSISQSLDNENVSNADLRDNSNNKTKNRKRVRVKQIFSFPPYVFTEDKFTEDKIFTEFNICNVHYNKNEIDLDEFTEDKIFTDMQQMIDNGEIIGSHTKGETRLIMSKKYNFDAKVLKTHKPYKNAWKKIKIMLNKITMKEKESMQCIYCLDSFHVYSVLREHIGKIHPEYQYLCKSCPLAFKWQNSQKKHDATHEWDKPYKCNKCTIFFNCNSTFATEQNLIEHKNTVHPNKVELDIMCDKCLRNNEQWTIVQCSKCHAGYHSYCNQNGLIIKKKYMGNFINVCHQCIAKNTNGQTKHRNDRRSSRLKNKATIFGNVPDLEPTYETYYD